MLNDPGEQILARFPGPVTLKPRWLENLLWIAFWTLFTIATLWLLLIGGPPTGDGLSSSFPPWMAGLAATVFAILAVFHAMMLLRNRLTLDREGFELVYGFRKRRYLWKDVSAFDQFYIKMRTFAVFDHAGARKIFIPDDYGLGGEQITELLNRWRERALSTPRAWGEGKSAPAT